MKESEKEEYNKFLVEVDKRELEEQKTILDDFEKLLLEEEEKNLKNDA